MNLPTTSSPNSSSAGSEDSSDSYYKTRLIQSSGIQPPSALVHRSGVLTRTAQWIGRTVSQNHLSRAFSGIFPQSPRTIEDRSARSLHPVVRMSIHVRQTLPISLEELTPGALTNILKKGVDNLPADLLQTIKQRQLEEIDKELLSTTLCNHCNFPKLSDFQKAFLEEERKAFLKYEWILRDGKDASLLNSLPSVMALPVSIWHKMKIEFRTILLNYFWKNLDPRKLEMILDVCDTDWNSLDPELIQITLKKRYRLSSEEKELLDEANERAKIRGSILAKCQKYMNSNGSEADGIEIAALFTNSYQSDEYIICKYSRKGYREALKMTGFDFKKALNNFHYFGHAIAKKIGNQLELPFLGTDPMPSATLLNKGGAFILHQYQTKEGSPVYMMSKTVGGNSYKINQQFIDKVLEFFKAPMIESQPVSFALCAGDKTIHEMAIKDKSGAFSHIGVIAFPQNGRWEVYATVKGNLSIKKNNTDLYESSARSGMLGIDPLDLTTNYFTVFFANKGETIDLGNGDAITF